MQNPDREFEQAIRFITNAMPPATELEKPTLFHSLRVGVYLYQNGYNLAVCLGGLLHDALENTKVTKKEIEEKFGLEVASIVEANTKKESQQEDAYKELLLRCIAVGESALIVKAADLLDNLHYYSSIREVEGLIYVRYVTTLMQELKPENFTDVIFTKLSASVAANG